MLEHKVNNLITGLLEARRIRNFATEKPKKLEALPKNREVKALACSGDHVLLIVETENE